MKRILFESVITYPFALTETIDRSGALSAVLAVRASAASEGAKATITLTHADALDSEFVPVMDTRLFLNKTIVTHNDEGEIIQVSAKNPIEAGDVLNIDIDLLGCKRYVKFDIAYTGGDAPSVTATYSIALGDYADNPPME